MRGWTNLIFGKILVLGKLGKWVKMLVVNEIAGFLNQLYYQNKIMKNTDLLHVYTNLLKVKVDWKILGWA